MEADFSGYVTKAGLKCSDGRTITAEAFKHMDGQAVAMVWMHGHSDANNVLGHVMLEAREDGVYGHGYFNDTEQGKNAKKLVAHKDIRAMSIYANQLVEKAKSVLHGTIREVSLVISGANPGALIDYVRVAHSADDVEVLEDEAVIYTGLEIVHTEEPVKVETESTKDAGDAVEDPDLVHATKELTDDPKLAEIYATFNEQQQNLVLHMIGKTLELAPSAAAAHSENPEGPDMNVFEEQSKTKAVPEADRVYISHDDMKGIVADAMKGGTLKEAVEAYAIKHGIENIDVLFPDAKNFADRPEFNQRRMEWVSGVLGAVQRSPFSRVKTIVADITLDEARARGYVKGDFKEQEWFGVTKRITTPTTIYKKQQLDRDDVVDITDFDVVAWLKVEMRMMLEEEIARAILFGDGRSLNDPSKIKDPMGAADGAGIRAIANDHELYATTVNVNVLDANSDYNELVEAVLRARRFYKGTGMPTFYTTEEVLTEMLLSKDGNLQRRWKTVEELAAAMRVSSIVSVEAMETEPTLIGIVVNLRDYNVGADKGGEINLFDDFDIDYNQLKYLMETRISGALVKIKSALIIRSQESTAVRLANPTEPSFVPATGVITIPTMTNVVYKNDLTNATLSAGAQSALAEGASLTVRADAATGYYFDTNAEDQWTFTRPTA
jgi:HK97 family phage prohead protease